MAGEKEYVATITLGATSLTDDAEGTIKPTTHDKQPTTAEIEAVLRSFIGDIEQVPPAYSAIKIRGRKAYELARQGKTLKLQPRTVHIEEIELLGYDWPELKLRIVCSKGTYIRSLTRDIGEALGCGAYLSGLTRTRSGSFILSDTISLEELSPDNWQSCLVQVPS